LSKTPHQLFHESIFASILYSQSSYQEIFHSVYVIVFHQFDGYQYTFTKSQISTFLSEYFTLLTQGDFIFSMAKSFNLSKYNNSQRLKHFGFSLKSIVLQTM
jgi:hypothetical protein